MQLLRNFRRSRLPLWLLLAALTQAPGSSATAQTPAAPQTPSQTTNPTPTPTPPQQSYPAPTPVPASSLPSIAPAVPQSQQPQTPQPQAPQPAPPPYHDPLQQPIVVAPAPAQPIYVPTPQPTLAATLPSLPAYEPDYLHRKPDELSSTYIPDDSPVYPMALRLYSLGYLNTAFISMRPWTRRALLHMLDATQADVVAGNNQQALEILTALRASIADEAPGPKSERGELYGVDSVYTRLMGIQGQILRDSFHLGQTVVNDYGRPYQSGFNDVTGFSTVNEMGRFSLYVRGEYQHAPAGAGYNFALAQQLSDNDEIPYVGYNLNQATIPAGPIAAQNPFRLMEATLSFHLLGHEISGGKSDAWTGPALGGAMGWSNNAENIYSFRINRVEPLIFPWYFKYLGALRYDFFVGSLKGHTMPNSPWIHSEMFSFRPTSNFEYTFQRGVIWGGEGHVPVTFHTFLRSFFSTSDTESNPAAKNTASDPGARFSSFSFSWRLPFMSHSVTLYTDSECHDDVTPPSAPRRAAYRPGIYFSHLPHAPRFDLRFEASNTDTSTLRSINGSFNYWETIQRQGYTNKGFILGDWVGREAKSGQVWLTYHLSGNEWIQLEYLKKKTPKDFIPGGTTQDQFKLEIVKRLQHDLELDAWLQVETWKAPIYLPGARVDTVVATQLTWHPKLRTKPTGLNGK